MHQQDDGNQHDAVRAGPETRLLALGARHYAPDLGRFTQRDPVAGSLTQPQSLNRYTYVQNNPVIATDPSGLAGNQVFQATGFGFGQDNADNECLRRSREQFGGYVVNALCLNIPFLGEVPVLILTPSGPITLPGVLAATPPDSGTGDVSREEVRRNPNRYVTRESRIINALQITRQQWNVAIHAIKRGIEGNPDVIVDVTNGNVFDSRSLEMIGNVFDYIR